MDPNRKNTVYKLFLSLTNLWPAGLVALLVLLSLPGTLPDLKELPERLVLSKTEAAEPKPALPDPVEEPEQGQEPLVDSGSTYADGVYKGSARGYGGTITVQVTVKDGKITEIIVLSAPGETGSFLSKAKGVISRVIQAQTWEVDVVSGATYSSRGILGAIRNALTGEKVENAKPPAKPKPKASLKKEPFDDTASWKDGVYTGSAMGFGGTIKVEVTIKDGKIADIRILEHKGETSSYFNKAKKVVSRILKAGTPNVDTISGATYSSTGIINAVKNALKKAAAGSSGEAEQTEDPGDLPEKTPETNPEEEETEPDTENGLNDGTYETDVDCTDGRMFDYTIHLTMVVRNGKIISIKAKRTRDRSDAPEMNETFLKYAVSGRKIDKVTYKGIVSQILAAQTTKDVDTVSGATYSSNAILRGVRRLLAKAAKNKEDIEDPEDDPEKDPEEDPEKDPEKKPGDNGDDQEEEDPGDDPSAEDGLIDGTYSLEAVCTDDPDDPLFDYTILVTMKVKNDRIISLTAKITEDRSDDPEMNKTYFSYAVNGRTKKDITYKSVTAQILEAQSTKDIDTVSGATYSSRTIISAAKKLLRQAAKTKTEDPEEDPDEKDPEQEDPSDGEGENGDEKDSSGDGEGDDDPDKPGNEDNGDPENPGDDPASFRDGTFTSEIDCTDDPDDPTFDYTLKIAVTIEEGKIISVEVEQTEDRSEEPDDNIRYINFAKEGRKWKGKEYKGVPAQIISTQGTTEVDTVSGATWSSKAILQGAKEALADAAEPDDEENPGGEDSGGEDPENPQNPENPDNPGEEGGEDPGNPQNPENPDKPGGEGGENGENHNPENPDNPGEEGGEDPGNPQNPENPDKPGGEGGESGENQNPEDPGKPGEEGGEDPGNPQNPENPDNTGEEGGEDPGNPQNPEDPDKPGENEEEELPEQPRYLDGTYTAEALCTDDPDDPFFYYTIKVTVVVEEGMITKASAEKTDDDSEEPEENDSYMAFAANGRTRKGKTWPGIPTQIVEKQGAADLDAVSGATWSSSAMIEAFREAVEEAENPNM